MKKEFNKIKFYFFTSLLVLVSFAFFLVIKPMVYPIFWAGVLAWLFHPLYRRINNDHIHNKSLASFLTILMVILLIIIPLIGIFYIVFQQSIELYRVSESEVGRIYEKLKIFSEQYGDISFFQFIEGTGVDLKAKAIEYTRVVSGYVFSGIAGFTGSTVRFIIGFFIMLYTLYYFLKDGEWMIKKILHLSPLDDKSEKLICDKFTSVIRATMKGTFLVALIQGALGGIVLWIAGVVSPAFWALFMTIFALLPSVAPGVITFPAAIILFIQGNVWQAIFVLIFGVGLVATIDNMLRPVLVGRDIHMHPLLVFFATIGGLLVFGISGFVIGPIIASVFIALWTIYEHKFRKDLDSM